MLSVVDPSACHLALLAGAVLFQSWVHSPLLRPRQWTVLLEKRQDSQTIGKTFWITQDSASKGHHKCGLSEGNVPVKMRTRRVVSPELCPGFVFKFWSWGWEKMHSWNEGFWETLELLQGYLWCCETMWNSPPVHASFVLSRASSASAASKQWARVLAKLQEQLVQHPPL